MDYDFLWELYSNAINGSTDTFELLGHDSTEATKETAEMAETICALGDKAGEDGRKLEDKFMGVMYIAQRDWFKNGFCMGVRLMASVYERKRE